MTTICLSEEMIALLGNLDKPLEFCDESGCLLGSFIPEEAAQELEPISVLESKLQIVEEHLGPEMCIFGFETDLE